MRVGEVVKAEKDIEWLACLKLGDEMNRVVRDRLGHDQVGKSWIFRII